MLVRATQNGYFDHKTRKPGDEFEVRKEQFSKNWMQRLDGEDPEVRPAVQESAPAPVAKPLKADKKAKEQKSVSTGDADVI